MGSLGHAEINTAGEPPPAQVDGGRTPIQKLQILVVVEFTDGVVHQLVNHDLFRTPGGIGRARGGLTQATEGGGSIGLSSQAHTVFLRTKTHHIHDPESCGIQQVKRLACGAQSKSKLILVQDPITPGWNGKSIGKAKPVGQQAVGEITTGKVQLTAAAVVDLHEIQLRIIRVGQQLVDH